MNEEQWEQEMRGAQRRAEEARRAWRQAREEMRQAFRRAKEERKRAGSSDKEAQRHLEESLHEVIDAAQEFAQEVGDEARTLADDVVRTAKREWQTRWRDEWRRSFGDEGHAHWVFGGRRFRQWNAGADEANPFVGAILSRGAGLLAVYVLHLLAEQPRHGNDIMRQIEQRTAGSWTSNPGAIYPLLSFMEGKGLAHSQWEDPDKRTRRVYRITEEGQRELDRLRRVLRPKLMEAIEVVHVLYDDLYRGQEEAPPSTPGPEPHESPSSTEGPSEPSAGEVLISLASGGDEDAGWRARLGRLFGRGARQVALLSR